MLGQIVIHHLELVFLKFQFRKCFGDLLLCHVIALFLCKLPDLSELLCKKYLFIHSDPSFQTSKYRNCSARYPIVHVYG